MEPVQRFDDLRSRLASLATLLSSTEPSPPRPVAPASPPDVRTVPAGAKLMAPGAGSSRSSPLKPTFKTAPSKSALQSCNNNLERSAGGMLGRLREAEEGFAREKGRLNLELQHAQRRAQKLEAELRRAKEQLAFRVGEVKHLRGAVRDRDVQLAELADRVRGLEAADSGDRVAQQAVDAAEAERDELRSALQSSLARLEETTSLLALADPTVSGLGRQLQEAEAERQAAVEDAAAAQQQAQAAQQDAEDLRWRVGLLQQLADVMVRHNEEQAATLRTLLESQALLEHGDEDGVASSSL